VLQFTKPVIAGVATVIHPENRVEVCEDLDIGFEMVKLRTFMGFAFCHSCTKRVNVFTIHTRGAVKLTSAIVCVNLVGLLVVSDELVRDDD
jgi:hypothetical protein